MSSLTSSFNSLANTNRPFDFPLFTSLPRSVRTATVLELFSIKKLHKDGILAAVKRSRVGRQWSVEFRFTAYSFPDRKLSMPQTV